MEYLNIALLISFSFTVSQQLEVTLRSSNRWHVSLALLKSWPRQRYIFFFLASHWLKFVAQVLPHICAAHVLSSTPILHNKVGKIFLKQVLHMDANFAPKTKLLKLSQNRCYISVSRCKNRFSTNIAGVIGFVQTVTLKLKCNVCHVWIVKIFDFLLI